jgi:hypothetical protein
MKKLIYKDLGAKTEFQQEVDNILKQCNNLIEAFNSHQDFKKIETQDEFNSLVSDPAGYFDDILLSNVELPANLKPAPAQLALLFNIDRAGYLEMLGLEEIEDESCQGCSKVQKKPVSKNSVISFDHYIGNASYLTFEDGFFHLDKGMIEAKLKDFDIYAESPEQLETLDHYETLSKVLNSAIDFHKLGPVQVQTLSKMFGLQILNNKLVINYMQLSETIKYLKK